MAAVSTLSARTAQWSGVVSSTARAFTFAPSSSRRLTAMRSPRLAASSSAASFVSASDGCGARQASTAGAHIASHRASPIVVTICIAWLLPQSTRRRRAALRRAQKFTPGQTWRRKCARPARSPLRSELGRRTAHRSGRTARAMSRFAAGPHAEGPSRDRRRTGTCADGPQGWDFAACLGKALRRADRPQSETPMRKKNQASRCVATSCQRRARVLSLSARRGGGRPRT